MKSVFTHIINEIEVIAAAFVFYTRLPLPLAGSDVQKRFASCTRYLPFVGIVVGAISALVYFCVHLLFPRELAVLCSMIASILLTGAFHEDGFADTCDGFGGGATVEKKLKIMKDSSIGVFGTIGLILILLLKYNVTIAIPHRYTAAAIVAAHSASRFPPLVIIRTLAYVRKSADSKASLALQPITFFDVCTGLFFASLPMSFVKLEAFFLVLLYLPIVVLAKRYLKKQIGGYTGDTLGALQQCGEIIFYAAVYLLCTYLHLDILRLL